MTIYVGSGKIKDIGSTGVYLGSKNTKCLIKTPKNINLELNNGILTLKAGSKVYVPNGFDAVRYFKYTYAEWTQPVLTANGTLGGDSFAVFCDSPNNTSYPAYYAFDSSTSTFAVTHEADYIIYNKNPINITKIDMTVRGSSYQYKGGTLYGSNDNINWKEIIALSALTNGSWDISSNTGYYKYYKFSGSAGDWQPKTLTLTATQQTGSVESTADDYDYTIGNGKSKFDEVVIANDIVNKDIGSSTTDLFILDIGNNTISGFPNTICFSGDTAPTITGWALWYDTANNLMKYKDATSSWITVAASLPFCKGTWSGSILSSINQIFDWCGYIDSTAFVLPGVKGLIPNGFNADGTYKSIEFETSKVLTYDFSVWGTSNAVLYVNKDQAFAPWNAIDVFTQETLPDRDYSHVYIPSENKYWWKDVGDYRIATDCPIGTLATSNGKITSLTPYTAQPLTTVIPVKEIYNGSQLVYQIAAFAEPTILYNNGNIGAVTWTQQCPKGIYQLSLAGGGQAASTGYYYWPAGNRGSVLVCTFELKQPSLISVTLGVGGAAYGGGGGNTVFTIDGKTAVTCPGNGGTIIIDNTAINILSIITNNTGGGGGGSGSNPTPLSPWGDGGYTNSAGGRGGGMKLEWLRLK